ncbi:MAG: diguanylate cyclase, partial [Bacteroidetes bacterium RIFOXYB2_FULL_35_7]
EWTAFAAEIEKAGADALELNIFMLPSDFSKQGGEYENVYFDIISAIKKQVKIPVAVKIGSHFSGLANFIQKLSFTGIEGIVLFNRFLSFDIDIEKFDAAPSKNALSSPEEIAATLRWIALLSDKDKMRCGLIASTGVHDAAAAIKLLLAGAEGVQVCSALYKHGSELISRINQDIAVWMDKHKFASIADFRGKMNYKNIEDATLFYRTQYLKFASSLE